MDSLPNCNDSSTSPVSNMLHIVSEYLFNLDYIAIVHANVKNETMANQLLLAGRHINRAGALVVIGRSVVDSRVPLSQARTRCQPVNIS